MVSTTSTATRETREIDHGHTACDPEESANAAGLHYVSDSMPGITRRRSGRGFSYVTPDGTTIRDKKERERIEKLAIPPAWTDVWICPSPNGHIQATGRDAKGRKQYRYHPRWREVRDATKYAHMIAFGEALPTIREQVSRDLARKGLPREKVIAVVVRLLEMTFIRVGNPEYARDNGSYGLTTMRDRHVKISGSEVRFEFRGKGGKEHDVSLRDRRLARIVKRCREIPGYEVFQYYDDDGTRQSIESADVNEYLRNVTGQDFTAKDFRTWAGTRLALDELVSAEEAASKREAERNVVEAIKSVAAQLGNTPAVCRRCYVHPAVIDAYLEGRLDVDIDKTSEWSDERALHGDEEVLLTILREAEAS